MPVCRDRTPFQPGPLHSALAAALPQGGELDLEQTGPVSFAFRSVRVGDVRVFDLDLVLRCIAPLVAKPDSAAQIPDGAR